MGAPEVHRSGHTPVDPDHAAEVADQGLPASSGSGPGPVPPDNRPGHRPAEEQDKPRRRPPRPRRSRARAAEADRTDASTDTPAGTSADPGPGGETTEREAAEAPADAGVTVATFRFAFDDAVGAAARLVGVSPANAVVRVDGEHLTVTFGRWTLRTALGNVAATTRTGPYEWWKVAGPPRLSLADRGITFGTSARSGLCISFYEPVPAVMPTSLLRHPAATVTVTDPDGLAEALAAARARVRAA